MSKTFRSFQTLGLVQCPMCFTFPRVSKTRQTIHTYYYYNQLATPLKPHHALPAGCGHVGPRPQALGPRLLDPTTRQGPLSYISFNHALGCSHFFVSDEKMLIYGPGRCDDGRMNKLEQNTACDQNALHTKP